MSDEGANDDESIADTIELLMGDLHDARLCWANILADTCVAEELMSGVHLGD